MITEQEEWENSMKHHNRNVLLLLPLSLLITFVMLSITAQAQTESVTQCISNNTLQIYEMDERCINGVCRDFSTNQTQFCQFGCEPEFGICNPDPFTVNVIFAVIILTMIVLVAWVIRRLK